MERPDPQPSTGTCDSKAGWLHSDYASNVWVVAGDDADTSVERAEIHFRYMLPSGFDTTHPLNAHWLNTAKAYAWDLRQTQKITVAKRQIVLVRNLLHLMAWTQLRGRKSFSELRPSDIAELQKEAAYGPPFMLRYLERMAEHLKLREAQNLELPSRQMGGYAQLTIDQDRLCRDAHLNPRATMFCGSLVHDAAIAAGLRPASPAAPKPYAKKLCNWIMIRDILAPLERIYDLRGEPGVDAPNFQPFPDGSAKAARPVGGAVGRTPTPPARQYMFLLDRSMRWVADYGPPLLDALDDHRRGELYLPPADLMDLPATPFPLASFRKGKNGKIDLDLAITNLVAACYVVIGTFSARRKDELMKLKRGCFVGSAQDGFWLRSWIAKTLREEDETPAPACVGLAINLLERLAEGEKLFRWKNPFGAERTLSPNAALRRFVRFIEVPPQPNGKQWTFATHQFRRMFAILYVHRWRHGDLESLAHHLRHFDLRMTKRYLTKDELAEIDEEERRFSYEIALEIATGARDVGGKAGVRLKQMMARLRPTVEVHGVDRLPKLIERAFRRTEVIVKTNPWSYCLCPRNSTGTPRANCRKVGATSQAEGANLAEARPEVCRGCTFNMTDPQFAPFIEREIARTESSLKARGPAMLVDVLEHRLAQLRAYLLEIVGPRSAA